MGFKTSIPFSGENKEAIFVNNGEVSAALLGYDIPPFESWEGTENLVLRLELTQEGLRYPVRLTAYGSYETEEVEKEVTTGRGKNKKVAMVPTTVIKGMGSAFRVTDIIQDACASGQVINDIEIAPGGEIMVDGELLSPEGGELASFDALLGVKIFSLRYKANRRDGSTGYNTHRRFLTYREGEDDSDVESRLRADFYRQVRGGYISDYTGTAPDEDDEPAVVAGADGGTEPPF